MSDAVIIDAVRTPLGKGRPGGALAGVHPVDLLAHPLAALVERTGIDPRVIDDVIAGCFSQIGKPGTNIARRAALAAGYPERVPATTVVRPEESTSSTARPTSLTGSPRSEPEGEDAMKRLAQLVVAAAVVTIPVIASAQTLTEAQARAVITPWYVLFNQPVQGDMRTLQEQVLTADYESCWGYLPGECWGREASIKVVGGFAKSIPNMKFDIKEVLVSGDRVIVRGEVSGTPAGELFGVPHTGKSFRIMAIDIQTIRDGKIARTYHLENWLSALGQLRAK